MTLRKIQLTAFSVALVLGLLFWALVVWRGSNLVFGDGQEYDAIAHSLLAHHQFYTELARDPWEASAARPGGYPLLLAAVCAIAGPRPAAVTLLQVLLYALLCAFIARLAGKLFSLKTGLLAGLIAACWLTGLLVANTLHPDTLFAFALLATLWWLAGSGRFYLRGTLKAFGLAGLAAWLKPEALVFPALAAAGLAFLPGAKKARLTAFVAGCALFAVLLLPWIIRNEVVFGTPAFSNKGDTTLLEWDAALIEVSLQHSNLFQVRKQLWSEVQRELGSSWREPANQFKVGKAARKVFLRHLAAHPGAYVGRWLVATLIAPLVPDRILWFQLVAGSISVPSVREAYYAGGPVHALQVFIRNRIALLISLQWLEKLLILLGALLGFAAALKLPRIRPLVLLFAVVIAGHCLLLGPDAMGRLMLIVDPLLIILAAAGFTRRYWVLQPEAAASD